MPLYKTYKVQDVHLITEEFPPMFLLRDKAKIVPGLAAAYMPSWRVLNSMALIKGLSVSDVLIKQV